LFAICHERTNVCFNINLKSEEEENWRKKSVPLSHTSRVGKNVSNTEYSAAAAGKRRG
jgi:hypothetical protein